jgi:RimJ/RimL family protein N-acetyltransferase
MNPFSRRRLTIRPVRSGEVAGFDRVFAGLSPASRRARYLADLTELSDPARVALSAVDGRRHVALVAEVSRRRETEPVGLARFVCVGPGDAEVAYEVVDAWQGRGIGRLLLRELAAHARLAGIERLHATIHRDNVASIGLLRTELPAVRVRRDGELLRVTASLTETLTTADLLADLGVA